jgi:hypothetical protein
MFACLHFKAVVLNGSLPAINSHLSKPGIISEQITYL